MSACSAPPQVVEHDGIHVVRDDLFPGGTKARFVPMFFEGVDEVVYASPACGGAQTAIATVAQALGKRATILVAKRKEPHPRTLHAARVLGAKVLQVSPGYLSVVQHRARAYADARGALLLPFGLDVPEAVDAIGDQALRAPIEPDEVWCASGSGVLARGLAAAWPNARRHVVQVGRELHPEDVLGAKVWTVKEKFEQATKTKPPFPSDPHYDAKAWEVCRQHHGEGVVLFWNVTGPAPAVTSGP